MEEEGNLLRRQVTSITLRLALGAGRHGGRFTAGRADCHKDALCLALKSLPSLERVLAKAGIASNCYRALGMFDDAANAPEEIEPKHKTL